MNTFELNFQILRARFLDGIWKSLARLPSVALPRGEAESCVVPGTGRPSERDVVWRWPNEGELECYGNPERVITRGAP
jgi:hypothetical protein